MEKIKPHILIVEDEPELQLILATIVEASGYRVSCADNGKKAFDLIQTQDFSAIISDIQMPEMDGISLLKKVKAFRPIPFIVMTGYSNYLEQMKNEKLDFDGYLNKPFNTKEVDEILREALGSNDSNELSSDHKYNQIPIETLDPRFKLPFGLYIRISENNYVKLGNAGETLDERQIKRYSNKGVSFLYVKKDEFFKYLNFGISLGKSLSISAAMTQEKKRKFLKLIGEVILEKTFIDGVDKPTFSYAKSFVELSISVLAEDDAILDVFDLLNEHSNFLYAHSLSVCVYSVMIARKLGPQEQQEVFSLAIAGFFHDIGKKEIAPELLQKRPDLLNEKERQTLCTHPIRSMEVLKTLESIPDEVCQIVLQHHENLDGTGFPHKLTDSKIHPLSKIVRVADRFCNLVLDGHGNGISPEDAVTQMRKKERSFYDERALGALGQLFLNRGKPGEKVVAL